MDTPITPSPLRLRPAQEEILAYRSGRMAVSAVPGSGKTFTLSLLAAQLIADGRIDPNASQQVLVVTFLNASVDTFRARIRRRLLEMGLPDTGFDVRTLHSLALEIVRWGSDLLSDDLTVLDEGQSRQFLDAAVDGWTNDNARLWEAFLPDYDMSMARLLYWGCDVWLNNPLRPLEACGTSGMKSAIIVATSRASTPVASTRFLRRSSSQAKPTKPRANPPTRIIPCTMAVFTKPPFADVSTVSIA